MIHALLLRVRTQHKAETQKRERNPVVRGRCIPPHIGISRLTSAIASASHCPQINSSLQSPQIPAGNIPKVRLCRILRHRRPAVVWSGTGAVPCVCVCVCVCVLVCVTCQSPVLLSNADSELCYSQLMSSGRRHEVQTGHHPGSK